MSATGRTQTAYCIGLAVRCMFDLVGGPTGVPLVLPNLSVMCSRC